MPGSFDNGCVIALGTFDGLHPGHRAVIRACVEYAIQTGTDSAVYTFYENPRYLFAQPPLELMRPQEKIEKIGALGVDRVICVHFTPELAALSPEQFVDMLKTSYHPSAVVTGEDYTFGSGAAGDVALLREICGRRNIAVITVSLVMMGKEKISSTRIRAAIEQGDVATVNSLMKG